MTDVPDELEKLLADVRKTISENKQFLEKLVDETEEVDAEEEDGEQAVAAEDFEEL
jgi:hypothetical protein